MNKILLATTALVATAGFAAADVTLSGSAEMGIADSGNGVEFHHDLDVRFTLSGETDGGLTFGATIDLDEVGDDNTCEFDAAGAITNDPGTAGSCGGDGIGSGSGEHAVFISGGFGTLTLGDTDGAFDWAMQEVAIGSSIADDHSTHAGYNGNSGIDGANGGDGQVLRYDNTFGDFGVALSAELDDAGTAGGDKFGIGLKYNAALGGLDLGLGLGYQDFDAGSIAGLSVDTTFANGLRAILNYSDYSNHVTYDSHVALGLGYTSGALTVSANYGEYSGLVAAGDADGYGIAVNYDLGGAAVQFGYADDSNDADRWSLGLAMSF